MTGDGKPPSPYERPRVWAAAALTGAAVLMLIADVVSRDYTLADTTLGILLTGALALLAVEVSVTRRNGS